MKKKLAIVLAGIVVAGALGTTYFSRNKTQEDKKSIKTASVDKKAKESNIDLYVRYAFADVDMDQIIQDVDPKDDDKNADYIFMRLSAPIIQSNDKNNLGNIKNYKLDGKVLPENAQVLLRKDISGNLVIKLPQGYLKSKNRGHVLEISKDVVNGSKKIVGDTKLNLPYSMPEKIENKKNNDKTKVNNSNDKKQNVGKDKLEAIKENNKNMPKFTIEIGKGIPYTTIILVKLQTPKVEDYKVSVDNVPLEIRQNKQKQKVFIGHVKKDYTYDQVLSRVKVEKVK